VNLMRGSALGPLAAVALVTAVLTGLGGCALPHALPVEAGTSSSGPSPYGVWYEQHWATNSVLLAAADDPNAEVEVSDDDSEVDISVDVDGDVGANADLSPDDAAAAAIDDMEAAVEASAAAAERAAAAAEDFDNSTPYQFPASSFAPQAPGDSAPGVPASEAAPSGAIRY